MHYPPHYRSPADKNWRINWYKLFHCELYFITINKAWLLRRDVWKMTYNVNLNTSRVCEDKIHLNRNVNTFCNLHISISFNLVPRLFDRHSKTEQKPGYEVGYKWYNVRCLIWYIFNVNLIGMFSGVARILVRGGHSDDPQL